MKFGIVIFAMCFFLCPKQLQADANSSDLLQKKLIPIRKSFYSTENSAYYSAQLRLPINQKTGEIDAPLNFDEGAQQLLLGLDSRILQDSISVFNLTCGRKKRCQPHSALFWNSFYSKSEKYYVDDFISAEKRYDLSSYLTSLQAELGRIWRMDSSCQPGDSICSYVQSRLKTSSDMYAEMIFRKAILDAAGRAATLCDIAHSMGDMVAFEEAFVAECKPRRRTRLVEVEKMEQSGKP
jgi:hypothetical protein